ncbi:MAG TPA: CpsD/CapB family tyrosine-protein kinase [Candidatus Acidoferrales bacterium]|nr:CpsD/CapB family tyrosine-protein kinase [Candidatus Acidoferrales bacterium]
MSRNFELLHEAGKVQDMLSQPVEMRKLIDESPLPPPAPILPSTPAIQTEGIARDEVMKLVQRLFLSGGQGHRQVVFAGTEAGNGCSWVCARAADLLASQAAGSVCVVDCNMVSPTLHLEYHVENHHGLADALRTDESIRLYTQKLSRSNLWLLSAGSIDKNSEQQLTLEAMRRRLSELRAVFDYVLLDVAPLATADHASTLGKWCDGVALVLKANASSRKGARKVLEGLKTAQIPVLGAVLNQRTFPIPESIYNRL